MPVWVIYLVLAVLAAGVVALPLIRRTAPPAANAGEAGDQAPDVATAASERPPAAPFGLSRDQMVMGGGVIAVLVAAIALFLATGDKTPPPPLATAPPGAMGGVAAGGLPDVDTMIERLAKRLEAQPNDPEGWRMLGWSYFETQHYPEAAKAYARAVSLKPGDAAFQSAYGEALLKAAGDRFTDDALKAFRAALAADPKDDRARLYMALREHQSGDSAAALDKMFALLEAAPADSRLTPTIRATIRKVAAESGVDVSARLPPEPAPAAAGPSQADVAVAAQLPAGDQQAMISGMVGRLETRLAASPRDVDGWIMLMRSRKTLGQDDLARAARDKALTVFADDAAARGRLTAAARELGVS